MAQRQGFVRVDSAEVQGEGSFVVVRKISYAQRQATSRLLATLYGGQVPQNAVDLAAQGPISLAVLDGSDALAREMVVGNVVAWNWVDDAGEPMPLPGIEPRVMDWLTEEEVKFIVAAINKTVGPTEKN